MLIHERFAVSCNRVKRMPADRPTNEAPSVGEIVAHFRCDRRLRSIGQRFFSGSLAMKHRELVRDGDDVVHLNRLLAN